MKAFHEVRNYESDFMVWHGCYSNINFIAHWHRELELIYVRKGTAEIHVTDNTLHAQEGDLIVCDSGDIHYCNAHSDNSCLDFLLFDTGIISGHYHYKSFANPLFDKNSLSSAGLTEDFLKLLKDLDTELSEKSSYYQEIVKARVQDFWYRLLRSYPKRMESSVMQNRRKQMLVNFQTLLTYLEDHYDDNITLEDAAEIMGFSPSHFSRLFKQLTGTGFVRYLNLIRISQAAQLLTESDRKITDIAFLCGFSNVRTFNRAFLEITGYTPSAYIRQPESKSYNFTYYRSSDHLFTQPADNPTIIKDNDQKAV